LGETQNCLWQVSHSKWWNANLNSWIIHQNSIRWINSTRNWLRHEKYLQIRCWSKWICIIQRISKFFILFRLTSSSKDIVLKWVFKTCIELEKCPKELIEKWLFNNLKHFVTMLGNSWKFQFLHKLLDKFSMMLIKTKMDLLHMLNISNSLKNTSVKQNLNSKQELILLKIFHHQLIWDQKDFQGLENGFGNNFINSILLMLVQEIYLLKINNSKDWLLELLVTSHNSKWNF
jgi:hypothetical protein